MLLTIKETLLLMEELTKDSVRGGITVARETAQCVKQAITAHLDHPPHCLVFLVPFQMTFHLINALFVLLVNIKMKLENRSVRTARLDMSAHLLA